MKDNGYPPEAPLLPNRFGQRLSRAGAAYQLQRLVDRAAAKVTSLKKRHISPHSFRHGTAMALLEANVPTEVIALYLGHESPKTTHLYVEASLAMKKQPWQRSTRHDLPTFGFGQPTRIFASSTTCSYGKFRLHGPLFLQGLARAPSHNYHLSIFPHYVALNIIGRDWLC